MLSRLLPREGNFFELFNRSAELIVQGSHEFREMLDNLHEAESRSRRVKAIEHQADEITHETIELLHKTFITPIDRDDVHSLISRMDDILDYLEAAAERVVLYGITEVTAEAKQLASLCDKAAEQVRTAVSELKNLKDPQKIIKTCVEINRIENEADQVLRVGIAKLFKEEPDTRQLIKLKELYELLETVTDRCEDVANTIEGIVLEYA